MNKIIFADESYKSLDRLTSRTVFCYTEYSNETDTQTATDTIQEKVVDDSLRFSTKGKLHYASLTPAQKASICDIISKLNYRCKLFIKYSHGIDMYKDEARYKKELLSSSLGFMLDKQTSTEDIIYIENAAGTYSKKDLANNVHLVDASSQPLFLIADIILGVFCDYVDRGLVEPQVVTNYTLVREKIRLQIVSSDTYQPRPLSREERI